MKHISSFVFLLTLFISSGLNIDLAYAKSIYKIEYLTIDQGLSQNTVNSILRDADGFMWFATGNGLNRYDGYSIVSFWKPDLPSSLVNALAESEGHLLWIGCSSGLTCLDRHTGKFTEIDLSAELGVRPHIAALTTDKEGRIWVGSLEHGLFLISRDHESGELQIRNFNMSNSQLSGNHVASFLEMNDGRMYIGTNHGICIADKAGRQIHQFARAELSNSLVLCMIESIEGDLWVGTFAGLWVIHQSTGKSELYLHNPNDPGSLSHNSVYDIRQDFRGTIYIGSLGGVDIFQPSTNSFTSLPYKDIDNFSLNSMFVRKILIDTDGNVWIGTEKGGVNHFNLYQKPFNYIVNEPNNPNSLSNNTINSIFSDGDSLWIGTAGGGLNLYNRKTGIFRRYIHQPGNPYSLSADYVTAITKTPDGTIWAGTWGSGLCRMLADGHFRTILPPIDNPETGYVNTFISSLLYYDGYLYIGTEGGLAIMDVKTETFVHLSRTTNALARISEIGALLRDSKNNLWLATRTGLFTFPLNVLNLPHDADCPVNRISVYKHIPLDEANSLPGNYITSVMEDREGRMWIGTYGDGLVKGEQNNTGDLVFRRYTTRDGLSNNVIYTILQDHDDNIWVSTDYGLSRINPDNDKIESFFTNDGLLSNQFYWSASYISESGELFFGSINGLSHFYPSNFPIYPIEPKASLTSLRVFNAEISQGVKRFGKVILEKPLYKTDEISLSYKDNAFSIEFSALDYFQPQKTRYAYRLEGVDKDWVEVSSDKRIATYTNLKGGSYTFRVRASRSDGTWGQNDTILILTIRPPFWQTGWFLTLLVLCLLAITYIYSRYHSKRLLLENERLERMVNIRTQKIKEQNEYMQHQAEILKEANENLKIKSKLIEGQKRELEAKNKEIMEQRDRLITLNKEIENINQNRMRFYTNITHEFRTPLTLIISPIDRLIREFHFPGQAFDMLNSIQRNARRLSLLIDQLLMFRNIETGNLKIRITNKDLKEFITEIFSAFDTIARQRRIDYTLEIHLPGGPYWYDYDKMEDIVYNLLSNAFKYTPEGGSIRLTIKEAPSRKGSRPSVSISVADSGVGISDDQMERIFERFYRSANGTFAKGSGIGLSLTRELVEAMNGTIMVQNNSGKGSRFIVTLPFKKEDFEGAEVNEIPVHDFTEMSNKVQVVIDNLSDDDATFEHSTLSISETPVVLVVEDNKELALFIANSLSSQYTMLLAENGKAGYEMAKKHSPDLIISDVMMPELDGIEMCRLLKNNLYTSHIPIILLSAKAQVENQLEGLQSGADDYVPKPFNLELLKAKVSNTIEARLRLRAMFTSQKELPRNLGNGQSLDDKFLSKLYEVLEASYTNPDFSVELFADAMFVSRSLLYKKLKALLDLSPNDFITVYRLKKSLPLLMSGEMSINEVAYTIGFNDPKYFSRVFKKFYKKTPSEYIVQQ